MPPDSVTTPFADTFDLGGAIVALTACRVQFFDKLAIGRRVAFGRITGRDKRRVGKVQRRARRFNWDVGLRATG